MVNVDSFKNVFHRRNSEVCLVLRENLLQCEYKLAKTMTDNKRIDITLSSHYRRVSVRPTMRENMTSLGDKLYTARCDM